MCVEPTVRGPLLRASRKDFPSNKAFMGKKWLLPSNKQQLTKLGNSPKHAPSVNRYAVLHSVLSV